MKLLHCVEELHEDRIWHVHYFVFRKKVFLLSCSSDLTCTILDCSGIDDKPQHPMSFAQGQHKRSIRHGSVSLNGEFIALGSFDSKVSVWETEKVLMNESDECEFILEGHESEVKSVDFDPNEGNMIVSCGRDKKIWVWQRFDDDDDFNCSACCVGHSQDVKRVKWHPSAEHIVSVSYDNTIMTWSEVYDDWERSNILRGHQDTVWDLDFDKKGEFMVTVGSDRDVILWKYIPKSEFTQDMDHDKPFTYIEVNRIKNAHKRTIYAVKWHPTNPSIVATAGADNAIRVYNIHQGQLLDEKTNAHLGDVNSISWHPTKPNILSSCGDDDDIKVWQVILP